MPDIRWLDVHLGYDHLPRPTQDTFDERKNITLCFFYLITEHGPEWRFEVITTRMLRSWGGWARRVLSLQGS